MGRTSEGKANQDQDDEAKDQAVWFGIELLGKPGSPEHASQIYQDLCQYLETGQVEQVNELLRLLLGVEDRG